MGENFEKYKINDNIFRIQKFKIKGEELL